MELILIIVVLLLLLVAAADTLVAGEGIGDRTRSRRKQGRSAA